METAINKNQFFPSLRPALMISMAYVDLGKWVAAVEAGSRFGSDLILPLLFFNLCAILCQYLTTCISTVTGKNLAEICQEEYSKTTCMLLGIQAELSILISKLAMVLGIAQAFNLLLGFDLVTCILVAALATNILPFFVTGLEKQKARTIYTGVAAYALLGYVLGVLFNQPKIPLPANVMFPKLSGESIYSLMALLGANVMAHNFYIHSSLVQNQRSPPVAAIGALFHDHFFTILFIFTGLFLVYFIIINSAAVLSSTADVILNVQDVVLLMDQVFPMVPLLFLSILLFSSQITTLTCNIGAHIISRHFFGVNLSLIFHHLLLNSLTLLPALYFTKYNGAEGIYQLLTICQVVQAVLLPSSVIPLFRVASSKVIMKAFKIPYYLEICSVVAFLMMLSANVIFFTEMLLGNSGWVNGLKGNVGNVVVIPYPVILLVSCLSVGLALFLAVTPLRSASDEVSNHNYLSNQQNSFSEKREVNSTGMKNVHFEEEACFGRDTSKSSFEYFEPESEKEAGDGGTDVSATTSTTSIHMSEELNSTVKLVDWTESASKESSPTMDFTMHKRHKIDDGDDDVDGNDDVDDDVETAGVVKPEPMSKNFVEREVATEKKAPVEKAGDMKQSPALQTFVEREVVVEQEIVMEEAKDVKQKPTTKCSVEREVAIEQDLHDEEQEGQKEIEQGNKSENQNSITQSEEQLLSDEQLSFNSLKVKDFDSGNGSRSLTHLSGLGRSARKQLAVILDEFWGNLFDYHGKLTQEASTKKLDVLLGLDSRIVGSGDKTGSFKSNEPIKNNLIRPASQMTNLDLAYGLNAGSPSWSQGMQLPPTSNGLMDQQSGRLYANFNSPVSYSDNQFYQPATIHGYQLASYLKGLNTNRGPYSGALPDLTQPCPLPYSSNGLNLSESVSASTYTHNMLGSLNEASGAGLQSPISSRLSRLLAERNYIDSSLLGTSETLEGNTGYTKKYHSSPDISAMIAATRAALLNEAKLSAGTGTIGPQPYLSRMASDRSQSHLGPISRSGVSAGTVGRTPLGFDELGPQSTQRDLFSLQSNPSSSTKSLWSKQPFEQLFGITMNKDPQDFTYADAQKKLLQSLRFCINKLLKLEGASWLFTQNGGCDEELINRVAGSEKLFLEKEEAVLDHGFNQVQHLKDGINVPVGRPVPNCGEDCVWRVALVVSFGVWCIRRVLDLSLVESRPELWGKYTYVLNRLQGILDLAFSKPRSPLTTCTCLVTTNDTENLTKPPQFHAPLKANFTTASTVLEMIKDVEMAVASRKGRTGTAAGDVAFPKGKENLASVLKRYKRRLSNKSAT